MATKNTFMLDLDSLPVGYRFVPLEGELIVEYLKKKLKNEPLPPNKIKEVELYKYSPEELEDMYSKNRRETDMFFFTQRDRKHQNGSRPNRNTGSGYWKATAADKPVTHNRKQVGFKKTLVFYSEKTDSKRAKKTNWIMHEFRVDDLPPTKKCPTDMKLDWVLCRIHLRVSKPGTQAYQAGEEYHSENVNDDPMHQDSDNNEEVDIQKVEIPEAATTMDDVFESLEAICSVPSTANMHLPGPQNLFLDFPEPSISKASSIYADDFQTQNSCMDCLQQRTSMASSIYADVFQTQNSVMDLLQPSSSMPTIYADEFQTPNASSGTIMEMAQPLSSMPPLLQSPTLNPFKSSYMRNQNQNMWGSTSITSPYEDDNSSFGYPSLWS